MEMIDPIALDGPKPRPRQVDFNIAVGRPPVSAGALSRASIPATASPACAWSAPLPSRGKLVILQTGGPIDADLWRGHLPTINAWLGGTWAIAATAATTITLVQRPPLPAQHSHAPRVSAP